MENRQDNAQNQRPHWSHFECDAKMQNDAKFLEQMSLSKADDAPKDAITRFVQNLELQAMLEGHDLWTYSQNKPHLFSVGGVFYVYSQKMGCLDSGRHFPLPHLGSRLFCYNKVDDRLDICMKPYGHFAVEPDIEELALSGKVQGDGIKASKASTNIRMPSDLPPLAHAEASKKSLPQVMEEDS